MAYVTVGQSETVVKHPLQNNAPAWVERRAAEDTEVQMYTLGTFLSKEQPPGVCISQIWYTAGRVNRGLKQGSSEYVSPSLGQ